MLSIFDSNNLIYQGEGTMHIYDKFSSIDTYDYDSFYNIIQSQRTELIRNELKQHYASLSLHDFKKSADIPSNCSILIEKWQFDIFLILSIQKNYTLSYLDHEKLEILFPYSNVGVGMLLLMAVYYIFQIQCFINLKTAYWDGIMDHMNLISINTLTKL